MPAVAPLVEKGSDPQEPKGLSQEAAAARLAEDGPNSLPATGQRGFWVMVLNIIREPMLMLLIACGIVYLILGDPQEATLLLCGVIFIFGITIVQEQKTERALDALKDLSSPRTLVIRGGHRILVPSKAVVRGDVVVLGEGDRVPADGILLRESNLQVDESVLTGESLAVSKRVARSGDRQMAQPGGDNTPFVFSGTMITRGSGLLTVTATGSATAFGKIGAALFDIQLEGTRLQGEVTTLVRRIATFSLFTCLAVMVIYGLEHGRWLKGVLTGLSLAMAMIPEEFPVVLTIFLAIGAWRLSKAHVLARRIPVIETLGSATVLCVDKTGTLTENRMKVIDALPYQSPTANTTDADVVGVIHAAALASTPNPFDPMEKAIFAALSPGELLPSATSIVKMFAISPELPAMTNVWQDESGLLAVCKGAPEAVLTLCNVTPALRERVHTDVSKLAAKGLRVLGVAQRRAPRDEKWIHQADIAFDFVGLIGLADPIRTDVPPAIAECHRAGIRVVMITGDHPQTALAIAGQAGIRTDGGVTTGAQLSELSEDALQKVVQQTDVYARITPEQKLRLIKALIARGEVVGMTGDGVNDAPALKAAHIGIAMGERGTEVAREAASLILLGDRFASIVDAVRTGRRIYDHIQKAMAYIVAVHIPIAGMTLIPAIMGWPEALLPVHILFLELVIDPACTIAFEAEPASDDIMERNPRDPKANMFTGRIFGVALIQGAISLIMTLAVYMTALLGWRNAADAIAISFATLVLSNIFLMFANRSWTQTFFATLGRPNPSLWWISGGTFVGLGVVLYTPMLRKLFHFSVLHPADLGLCLLAATIPALLFEAVKRFAPRLLQRV
jgi:Ca2+-transporting ATPase